MTQFDLFPLLGFILFYLNSEILTSFSNLQPLTAGLGLLRDKRQSWFIFWRALPV